MERKYSKNEFYPSHRSNINFISLIWRRRKRNRNFVQICYPKYVCIQYFIISYQQYVNNHRYVIFPLYIDTMLEKPFQNIEAIIEKAYRPIVVG